MKTNASAASTPSYAAAWDRVHQAKWPEDQARMAHLNAALEAEPPGVTSAKTPEQKARLAAGMRRWRAAQIKDRPLSFCEVCNIAKRGWGKRCPACANRRKCKCGHIMHKGRTVCPKCGRGRV